MRPADMCEHGGQIEQFTLLFPCIPYYFLLEIRWKRIDTVDELAS